MTKKVAGGRDEVNALAEWNQSDGRSGGRRERGSVIVNA
jgi:hypothetical protein